MRTALHPRVRNEKGMKMYLRRPVICIALTSAVALAACSKPEKPYAVEEVSLAQVSSDLADGKTTSVAATKAYIERIKAMDAPLHAVISIAPDALEQAAASDARRKAGKALGPLDGVPIMIKDNIDAQGQITTAGSYALINNKAAKDSEVARRLRAADPTRRILLTSGFSEEISRGNSPVPLEFPMLRKPYALDDLLAAVTTALASPQPRDTSQVKT